MADSLGALADVLRQVALVGVVHEWRSPPGDRRNEVADPLRSMHPGATEFPGRHFLAQGALDDFRAGERNMLALSHMTTKSVSAGE